MRRKDWCQFFSGIANRKGLNGIVYHGVKAGYRTYMPSTGESFKEPHHSLDMFLPPRYFIRYSLFQKGSIFRHLSPEDHWRSYGTALQSCVLATLPMRFLAYFRSDKKCNLTIIMCHMWGRQLHSSKVILYLVLLFRSQTAIQFLTDYVAMC